MYGVAETEGVSGGVLGSYDFVDGPFGDVEDLDGDAGVANEALDLREIVGFCGCSGVTWFREDDEHPFMPRLDHACDGHPCEIAMLAIGLHHPVQISRTMFHQFREIGSHQHVDRQP